MTILKSFKYAINGIKDAIKSEPNFRFHLLAGVLVIILSILLGFNYIELAIITIAIAIVILLELINTIVEKLVDHHTKEISEEARIIKDMSASVVLLGSLASVIIGIFVFANKLL